MSRTVDDDESLADLFRARAEESKIKRAMNRQSSAVRLTEAGITFESRNNGAHLIVDHGAWDFWPGTGLFKHRTLPMRGRGVSGLIKRIKEGATK